MKLNPILSVEYELPAFFQAIGQLSPADALRVLRNTMAGLDAAAKEAQTQWKNYASGQPIPGSMRRIGKTGAYANSIRTDLSKSFEKRIFTDSPYAKFIETGHGEIDLKSGLLHGPKARLTKGKPGSINPRSIPHAYNVVSFRHGSPQSKSNPMPKDVFAEIRRMFRKAEQQDSEAVSSILAKGSGTTVTHPDTGATRQLDLYSWGVRAFPFKYESKRPSKGNEPKISKAGYSWRTGKFTDMVHMQSGEYRTFRTVSSLSNKNSWRVPALEGVPIRQKVIDTLKRKKTVERLMMDAMLKDLGMQGMKQRIT